MIEDFGTADVASVEDEVAALDGGQGFGTEEAVGVGDDGGFHGGEIIREWVGGFGQKRTEEP